MVPGRDGVWELMTTYKQKRGKGIQKMRPAEKSKNMGILTIKENRDETTNADSWWLFKNIGGESRDVRLANTFIKSQMSRRRWLSLLMK